MTNDHPVKHEIWSLTQDLAIINRAKGLVKTNPSHPEYWHAVKRRVEEALKPRKAPKRKLPIPDHIKQRYRSAKLQHDTRIAPLWVKDGHFLEPEYPDVGTSGGLQNFIIQYITWSGGRATRINVMGRTLPNGKRIPSSTRKGTADVSSTIKGKSVMWEIKIGSDKPSPDQLKEQERERRAGGEYFFVKTPEEFFLQYDSLSYQRSIFDTQMP